MQTVLTRAELEAHDPEGGKGGRWLCPLPGVCEGHTDPRKHRSLHLESNGVWNCHRCKAGGQLKDNWKEREFKPFKSFKEQEREARAKRDAEESRKLSEIGARFRALGKPLSASALALLGASGQAPAAQVAPVENGSSRTVHTELKEVLYRAGSLQGLDDTRARAFLSSRGFSDFADALTRARVRFAPDFGRREATEEKGAYRGAPALVFPISDDAGQLVAFQGRKTEPGDGLKVLTFGPKTSGLFWGPGSREAFQKGEALAICEAPLDALSLAVCQVPAVALCGSSHLPEFISLRCFGRRYWLAFDADKAGDEASQVIGAELLRFGGIVERLRPTEAKDWNEALQAGGAVWDRTAEALRALIAREAKARPVAGEPSGDTKAKHSKSTDTGTTEHDFMEGTLPHENLRKPEIPRENKAPELRQLEQVGAETKLTEVVAWALSEARRGFLPEPAEALPLPSGQSVAPNGAAAWLIAAESRSVGLEIHSHTSIDCTLALGIVQRDMEAIAMWARHARLWEDAPYTHQGALCLLPVAVEELRSLAAGLEWV